MTNREVELNIHNLQNLRGSGVKFPASVTYAIARNEKLLASIEEDILQAKTAIVQEHAEAVPDEPGYFRPKEGHAADMEKELLALDVVDNDVNITKIKIADLNNMDLSMSDMDSLYFMLDEE